ncbi:lytic transglycosylase domain-containing protein [Streptomyces griseoviridis]|uniref:Lytic transglycosylase domain-containing protein n=3 Tax=Streptomyces TaxID=1883 RepID=A0A3S9ZFM4_STRGD|nr:lytic transglycosylase domain-containing protein [Streptomyces griseoviridis]MDT0470835.1 transglycosylase SLT domain-containing protein [Streptomyces sp. DSM 41014]QCN86659.1 lytic transglycosylase domain-containing protein [Streptomyces griseoviridis]
MEMNATTVAIAAGGTGLLGCMGLVLTVIVILGVIVQCAIGVLLWPLVLICHIFGCGGGGGGGGGASYDQQQVQSAYQSDGKGALADGSVPADLLEAIKAAGRECTQIGPVVIASQIQAESRWDKGLVGPDGREGISQMPKDKFEEFGKDDDDNGKTSALDAEDSIRAQGRYLCSLEGEVNKLLADGSVVGGSLDLTLTAYDVGLDAVKAAKGVPKTARSQGYIAGIRSQFALYGGAIKPPDGEPYPTDSAYPSFSASPPAE